MYSDGDAFFMASHLPRLPETKPPAERNLLVSDLERDARAQGRLLEPGSGDGRPRPDTWRRPWTESKSEPTSISGKALEPIEKCESCSSRFKIYVSETESAQC